MNGARTGGMIVARAKRSLALAAASCLLAGMAAGCAGGGKSASGGAASTNAADAPVKPELRYKVVAIQTGFYHTSLQQPGGADEELKRDTRLTLVKRYGGFSQVKTVGGLMGYVASDEIAPLSAQEISEEEAALQAQQAPAGALAPVNGPGSNYAIPPEASHESVLPVQDTGPAPKPTPNPMFRY